jgi:hypothetical protein
MDNKQLRTAMVTSSISKPMCENQFGTEVYLRAYPERLEGFERALSWRNSLPNLDLSIAARGATEGLWYMDLLESLSGPWESILLATAASIDLHLLLKQPKKVLSFDADKSSSFWLHKLNFPESQLCFVNNQTLWNFEQFMRDFEGDVNYDIDYSVVDRSEIGEGEATGFDMIFMPAHHALYENGTMLLNCVDALASGGVLLVTASNNSGKLYRDDYWFHPNNEIHKLLKSSDGALIHESGLYGYTTFVKN